MVKKCSKKKAKQLLKRLFPWTNWLFNYKIRDLQYDLIAGVTVGLTLVPQCVAYAQMAITRAEYGLYSGIIAQLVYIIFGTSKDASIGPSAIISMLLGQVNALNPLAATEGDSTYLTLLSLTSGAMMLLVAILKLGFIVNLFSIPVINGFTTASGLAIIASQLKLFFGLSAAPSESPAMFFKQIWNVFSRHSEIKLPDVVFGIVTVSFLLFMQYMPLMVERIIKTRNRSRKKTSSEHKPSEKLTPKQTVFMEYLRLFAATRNVIVFASSTALAYVIVSNNPTTNLSVVGHIKPGLPTPRLPAFEVGHFVSDNQTNATNYVVLKTTKEVFSDLTVSIVIIPAMMMMEMFAITKSLGRKNGYRIDATNELVAVGLGNAFHSFFSCFPVNAAVARCALNDQCRVKTLLANVVSASVVMLATGLLTETFYYIPKAALAGIIMTAAYNLIDVHILRPMAQEYWRDLIILISTFLLCLCFDLAYGIMIMLLVNMITFLRPIVRMKIYVRHERGRNPGDRKPIRTTIVQLSHGMKYPSADKFLDRMAHVLAKSDKHIILDCRFFSGVDYTGLQALRGILLVAFNMKKHIIFTNMSARVQRKLQKIGLDHCTYADTVIDAVKGYDEIERQNELIRLSKNEKLEKSESEQVLSTLPKRASLNRLVSIARSPSHQALSYLGEHHHHRHHRRPQHLYHRQYSEDGQILMAGRKPHSHQDIPSSSEVDSHPLPEHSPGHIKLASPHTVIGFHIGSDDEEPDDNVKRQTHTLIRNLSRTAYIYDHIPIILGNVHEDGSDSGSDIEEDSQSEGSSSGSENDDDEPLEALLKHQESEHPLPVPHASSGLQLGPQLQRDEVKSASWSGRHHPSLNFQHLAQHFSKIDEDAVDEDEQAENANKSFDRQSELSVPPPSKKPLAVSSASSSDDDGIEFGSSNA